MQTQFTTTTLEAFFMFGEDVWSEMERMWALKQMHLAQITVGTTMPMLKNDWETQRVNSSGTVNRPAHSMTASVFLRCLFLQQFSHWMFQWALTFSQPMKVAMSSLASVHSPSYPLPTVLCSQKPSRQTLGQGCRPDKPWAQQGLWRWLFSPKKALSNLAGFPSANDASVCG